MALIGTYFCIGPSLATLVNVEISLNRAPNVIDPTLRIPLQGPVRKVAGDGTVTRSGKINVDIRFDDLELADLMRFIPALWGNFTTSSLPLFASWLDASQHYSPFSVTLESPQERTHYEVADETYVTNARIPGIDWTLLSVAVDNDTVLTASDRLVLADTSGGDVLLTLPDPADPEPYTPFSAVVDVAGNDLILDPDGPMIDGASTLVLSTLKQRVEYYTDGANWFTISY